MDNSGSNTSNLQRNNDVGRRSFMWKVGAGMSAVLAAAVPGIAKTSINNDKSLKSRVDTLSKQVQRLEDENAIRNLYKAYEKFLHDGNYKEVVNLFTDDAEVVFNGGLFKGKNKGVHRFYCDFFNAGSTGRKMEPAPGFEINEDKRHDFVEISMDQRSAKANFPYSIQVGTPIVSDSPLVKMAHLHGEGIMKWWEGGTNEVFCVKDRKDETWKIKRVEYNTLSRADYRPGRSYATPISIPEFSKVYPEEPAGPDKLVKRG